LNVTLAWLMLCAVPLVSSDEAAGVVRGRVVDAQTGEPIAKAVVAARDRQRETVTDGSGRFRLGDLAPGDVEVLVTTVGYSLARRTLAVDGPEVEIRLAQEALRRSEEVAVTTAVFEPADPAAPSAYALSGTELENLANVLVDDPLRSVQSLPGVAASDDFEATFAVRGLGFEKVGLYMDGVLMSAPFHTIRDANDAYSLTLVNGDVVESVDLLAGSAPARYGDRVGSVLGLKLREGSREEFFGRASLGATGLYATLEGPLGGGQKTSWLVSARKSYLDYVLDRLDSSGFVLGYYDVTARLAHHLSPSQTLTLGFVHGRSDWRNTEDDPGPTSDDTADAGTDLLTLQHRFIPSPRGFLETVAFVSRETGLNRQVDGTDTLDARGLQWGLRADATRVLGSHRVEGGLLLRQLSEEAIARDVVPPGPGYRVTAQYDAGSLQGGAYLQDTWTEGRVSVTAGLRLDTFGKTDETRLLPRAALLWNVAGGTRVFAGFGRYAQFPRFEELLGEQGNPELRSQSATHFSAGIEHALGATTRIRVEAYDEELRDLPFVAAADWRIEDGRIRPPQPASPLQNVLDGWSRGVEVMLQRRSANGLSGWIAYSLGHARVHEEPGTLVFDTDFDQRHTLTVFGSYRITPTLNLSTKYRYGSGFPVAGFYEARGGGAFRQGGGVFLSEEKNLYRPESYSRWDLRANKAFLFDGWKLTLYGEVINVLDREHRRYTGLDGLDLRTGRAFLETDTLFPLLPSIGVTVDF
jgi:hypothetical protein